MTVCQHESKRKPPEEIIGLRWVRAWCTLIPRVNIWDAPALPAAAISSLCRLLFAEYFPRCTLKEKVLIVNSMQFVERT